MTIIDLLILFVVGVAAIWGLIRGVVSQVMALLGLAGAYFWAPLLARPAVSLFQRELGSTKFLAQKVAVLVAGVAIYVGARLIGVGIEKLCVNRVNALGTLNRWGGALLGAAKGGAFVLLALFLLALVPFATLREGCPGILKSRIFQAAVNHNPLAHPRAIENMRRMRAALQDPVRREALGRSRAFEELVNRHGVKDAMKDDRILHAVKEGDYDGVREIENAESLMNDEALGDVLEKLSSP